MYIINDSSGVAIEGSAMPLFSAAIQAYLELSIEDIENAYLVNGVNIIFKDFVDFAKGEAEVESTTAGEVDTTSEATSEATPAGEVDATASVAK